MLVAGAVAICLMSGQCGSSDTRISREMTARWRPVLLRPGPRRAEAADIFHRRCLERHDGALMASREVGTLHIGTLAHRGPMTGCAAMRLMSAPSSSSSRFLS